jgi:hypothetical protein
MKNINRYKFTKLFTEEIKCFCMNIKNIHDINIIKQNFDKWKSENNSKIEIEYEYLKSIGYDGNFNKKLYKSVMHYYKNCNVKDEFLSNDNNNNNNNDNNKRQYITLEFEFLELIDNHIKRNINQNIKIKPSLLFDNFKLLYSDEITIQTNKIIDILSINDINNKIKKTYQNRYFNINKNN